MRDINIKVVSTTRSAVFHVHDADTVIEMAEAHRQQVQSDASGRGPVTLITFNCPQDDTLVAVGMVNEVSAK